MMPITSKAQRRKFAELLVKGDISPETFEEWNRGAGSAELLERLHPKAVVKPKRKAKTTRALKSKTARAKKGRRPAKTRGWSSNLRRAPAEPRHSYTRCSRCVGSAVWLTGAGVACMLNWMTGQ